MTKTILLVGGPDDGQVKVVSHDLDRYTVLREFGLSKKMVMLGFERGYYDATATFEDNKELFIWKGWEGEKN
jgi:hypothetical protein